MPLSNDFETDECGKSMKTWYHLKDAIAAGVCAARVAARLDTAMDWFDVILSRAVEICGGARLE